MTDNLTRISGAIYLDSGLTSGKGFNFTPLGEVLRRSNASYSTYSEM